MSIVLWNEFLKDHGNTVFDNWYKIKNFTTTNRIVQSIQDIKDDRVPELINHFKSSIVKSDGTVSNTEYIFKLNGIYLDLSKLPNLIIRNTTEKRNTYMRLFLEFLPDLPDNYMYNPDRVTKLVEMIKTSIIIRKICWSILRINRLENEEIILNEKLPNINNLDFTLRMINKDFLGVLPNKFTNSTFANMLKGSIYNVLAEKVLTKTSYGVNEFGIRKIENISDKSRKSYITLICFLRCDADNMYSAMLSALHNDGSINSGYLIDHLQTRLIANPDLKNKLIKAYIDYKK